MQERLTGALDDPDDGGVVDAFGALLPEGEYLPLLLSVEPRLVVPGRDGDCFSGEQVTTWPERATLPGCPPCAHSPATPGQPAAEPAPQVTPAGADHREHRGPPDR
ncbi:hypothetical protein [Streptomyces sp. A0592]|uniref:hypothetical protein n=1 Tax=Streptomyces sp. A0592 TaxID=2563099 RepID=UPI0014463AB6|nr:hypothetical protein [Streptomyces sp. A0592]